MMHVAGLAGTERRTQTPAWPAILALLLLCTVGSARGGEVEAPRPEQPAEAPAPAAVNHEDDLTKLTLEDLSEMEVTSVSRRPGQKLFAAPAAVTVLTPEDIRRTGHLHLPELLRLVPGMHIARFTANRWAITARGFSDIFNPAMLAQIDGRTIYSPFFAGVFWIAQDTVLEDLERVEAIRGPGATQWGANAVNGIISYTTKAAKDTQGLLVSGGGGNTEGGFGTVRFGGKAAEDLHYRVYAKLQEHASFDTGDPDYSDDWLRWQSGARFDWAPRDGADTVTWQGDVYGVERAGSSLRAPNAAAGTDGEDIDDEHYGGYNALARWTHKLGEENQTQLQVYYDYFQAKAPHNEEGRGSVLRAAHGTIDLDFQHSLRLDARQRLVYGLNYRTVDLEIQNGWIVDFDPSGRRTHAISGFVQDTITAIPDKLDFTVGAKLEHNSISNFEYQPSLKATLAPHKDHLLWGSISRAVRVPSLFENDAALLVGVAAPGVPVPALPNRALEPEELWAFEAGYRAHPLSWFTLYLAAFHNRYDDLIGSRLISALPPAFKLVNNQRAHSSGAELTATFQPFDPWRLTATYSHLDAWSTESGADDSAPRHQFHVRSYLDLPHDLELNAALYHAGSVQRFKIPDYWRADLGIVWRPVKDLELSVWGQNLLEDEHEEFRDDGIATRSRGRVPRSVYAKLVWRW